MKLLITIILYSLVSYSLYAQKIFNDDSLTKIFNAEVKSLDEFAARFNGEEFHPDITYDTLYRIRNLSALFDIEKVVRSKNKQTLTTNAIAFCDSILTNNVRFNVDNDGVYALAKCKVKFEGNIKTINLLMHQHKLDNGYVRWAIEAVSGLIKAGIVKTEKLYNISPIEHEIHFMGLDDVLNSSRNKAFGYRNQKREIDQLSVFLAFIQAGLIEFDMVTDLQFLCLDVPGFIFTIKETTRDSYNSGWLISDLIPACTEEKIKFLNNLCIE